MVDLAVNRESMYGTYMPSTVYAEGTDTQNYGLLVKYLTLPVGLNKKLHDFCHQLFYELCLLHKL